MDKTARREWHGMCETVTFWYGVFFFFFFGEMTDSGATYVVAHFVQLLCKETHITPPQDCPQYVSGEDFLCLLNVGGTVLSSAALIYVYMSPEESAVCLLPLPVSVCVYVYMCACVVCPGLETKCVTTRAGYISWAIEFVQRETRNWCRRQLHLKEMLLVSAFCLDAVSKV